MQFSNPLKLAQELLLKTISLHNFIFFLFNQQYLHNWDYLSHAFPQFLCSDTYSYCLLSYVQIRTQTDEIWQNGFKLNHSLTYLFLSILKLDIFRFWNIEFPTSYLACPSYNLCIFLQFWEPDRIWNILYIFLPNFADSGALYELGIKILI